MSDKPYTHKFVNGKCEKCGVKQGKEDMSLCPVIGREEVDNFREVYWGND